MIHIFCLLVMLLNAKWPKHANKKFCYDFLNIVLWAWGKDKYATLLNKKPEHLAQTQIF